MPDVKQKKPMKYILFFIILFLVLLTSARIGWLTYFSYSEQPIAQNGMIDLSDVELNDNETIALDGEWRFIPHEYVDANTFEQRMQAGTTELIHVPGDWKDAVATDESNLPLGIGTYYLKVELPVDRDPLIGITRYNNEADKDGCEHLYRSEANYDIWGIGYRSK